MIRVLIQRQISQGCLEEYLTLIRQARKQANTVDGFIAGELLHEKDNQHNAVIISSWENYEAWESWSVSEQRLAALKSMRSLLEEDEKVTILENNHMFV